MQVYEQNEQPDSRRRIPRRKPIKYQFTKEDDAINKTTLIGVLAVILKTSSNENFVNLTASDFVKYVKMVALVWQLPSDL